MHLQIFLRIRSALSLLRHSKCNEFGLKPAVGIVLLGGGGGEADSFWKCSVGTSEGKKGLVFDPNRTNSSRT
jgi:hypothetical protein